MRAVASWRGGYRADCDVRQFTFASDETEEYGGDDSGPMPSELLVASLASCFALAVVHVAKKREIELPDLVVRVESFRAERGLRYDRFKVEVESSYPDELGWLVEAAQRYCFVSNTLVEGASIEYAISSG